MHGISRKSDESPFTHSEEANFVSLYIFLVIRSSISFQLLDLPPMPQLTDLELVYSLQVLIEIMAHNVEYMVELHSKFVSYFCSFYSLFVNNTMNVKVINRLFLLIKDWINGDEQHLSNEDYFRILSNMRIIHAYPENTQFIGIFNIYWRFVYMLCVRCVLEFLLTDHQDVTNNETSQTEMTQTLRTLIFGGMISIDSSIRSLFRPLFYKILPSDFFARLQFLFNIVAPSFLFINR